MKVFISIKEIIKQALFKTLESYVMRFNIFNNDTKLCINTMLIILIVNVERNVEHFWHKYLAFHMKNGEKKNLLFKVRKSFFLIKT